MQCRRRHGDAYRRADRTRTHIVHEVLETRNAHRVAVKTARIGALYDLSAQYEAAVDGLIGRAQPRILAPEMGIEGLVAGPVSDSLGGEQRGIDFDAVAERFSASRNARPIAPHPQRHDS